MTSLLRVSRLPRTALHLHQRTCITGAASSIVSCNPIAAIAAPSSSSSSISLLSSSSFASFHTSSPRFGLFSSDETTAEKKQKTEQKVALLQFKKFVDLVLRDPFKLSDYESMIAMQGGEASSDAGWFDRAKAKVGEKMRQWQGHEQHTPAELKQLKRMLGALTPEEKSSTRPPNQEARKRVCEKTGDTPGDFALLLARYDQFLAIAEWYQWRKKNGRSLPMSQQDMQDAMKEDRKLYKMPRISKMDQRVLQIQKAMRPKMRTR